MRQLRSRFEVLSVLLVILVLWEGTIRLAGIAPYVMPAPSAILLRLVEVIRDGLIWPHLFTTTITILSGLGIGILAGLGFGALVGVLPAVERLIYPYIVALQTVPKIAIAPLFVLWFGYGIASKIVVAALISFFPVLVAVIAGLRSADRDQIDMMYLFGASRWQSFLHLRLFAALPMLFAGIEIASVMAVIGAVVGEFVGAQAGLGYLITSMNFNLDVPGVFAVLIVLSSIGITVHGCAKYLGRSLVFWTRNETRRAGGIAPH